MSCTEAQLLEVVESNLNKIDQVREKKVLSISVDKVKAQNSFSSRLGGAILIRYSDNKEIRTKTIWTKAVELPRESHQALERAFAGAASRGIAGPIPKPYFYDEDSKRIFMDMRTGINLLGLTLRYSFKANIFPNENLRKLFYQIGHWLQKYHATAKTEETINLRVVVNGVIRELSSSSEFGHREKEVLSNTLKEISNRKISEQEIPLVSPHNDFTLRNLFVQKNGGFYIIDWDAMVHPKFSRKTLCWWDLTTLIINLQSMLRFSPVIGRDRIGNLCDAILDGYFHGNDMTKSASPKEFLQSVYYVYTLRYWLGIESDRPLSKIYSKRMGRRYAEKLRQLLLNGKADITGRAW
jgi:hypothetical protein